MTSSNLHYLLKYHLNTITWELGLQSLDLVGDTHTQSMQMLWCEAPGSALLLGSSVGWAPGKWQGGAGRTGSELCC